MLSMESRSLSGGMPRANSNDSTSRQVAPQGILKNSMENKRWSQMVQSSQQNNHHVHAGGSESSHLYDKPLSGGKNEYTRAVAGHELNNGMQRTPSLNHVFSQEQSNLPAFSKGEYHDRLPEVLSLDLNSDTQSQLLNAKQKSASAIMVSSAVDAKNLASMSSSSTMINGLGYNQKTTGANAQISNTANHYNLKNHGSQPFNRGSGGIGVYQPGSPTESTNQLNFLQSLQNQTNTSGEFLQQSTAIIPFNKGTNTSSTIFPANVKASAEPLYRQLDGRSGVPEVSSTDQVSMSSFVPSAHMASLAQPFNQARAQEKTSALGSQVAAMTDPGQLALESWRGAEDVMHGSDKATSSRKQNLNKLDMNFHVLMEQNQRLEKEIREMNDQFTKRQNERLALASDAKKANDSNLLPLKTADTKEINQVLQPQLQQKLDKNANGQLLIENMKSSFDQRCQRTKKIVTELAQRLHEVKRDTFTELDRIQTRQSQRGDSVSLSPPVNQIIGNQRETSPKPSHDAKQLYINKKALHSNEHSREASKDNNIPSFNQSGISLKKVNRTDIMQQTNPCSFNKSQANKNLNCTENNLVEAMDNISPIRNRTNNDASIMSTTVGFNFRQLKPQDSTHTSMNELPQLTKSPPKSVIQQRFDNSPVNNNDKDNSAELQNPGFSHESIDAGDSQRQNGAQQRQTCNESLMQMIPNGQANQSSDRQTNSNPAGANREDNSAGAEHQEQLQQTQSGLLVSSNNEHNSRFSFQRDSNQPPQTNSRPAETIGSLTSQLRQFEQQQNLQTLNRLTDFSPLNVNGAAQLSNILQQINNQQLAAAQQLATVMTADKSETLAQVTQNSLVSPAHANNGQAPFFLSADDTTRDINFPVSFNQKHNIIAAALKHQEEEEKKTDQSATKVKNQSIVVSEPSQHISSSRKNNAKSSRLQSEETFNQLRMHLQGGGTQDTNDYQLASQVSNTFQDLGRNLHGILMGTNQTAVSERLSSFQTFDKMHLEILHLQDKIKVLEAQIITSPSQHNETQQTHNGHGDQKRTTQTSMQQATLETVQTAPYKHDSKHMQDSSRRAKVKMTVPKTVVVQAFTQNAEPAAATKPNQLVGNGGEDDAMVTQGNQINEKQDKWQVPQSYAISHRPIYSQPQVGAEDLSAGKAAQIRDKKKSFLTDVSTSNLLQGVVTYREKESDMTPLQREMSDLMSQSQPDLVNFRQHRRKRSSQQLSVKSISRLGSRRSSNKSKSPLSQRGKQRSKSKALQQNSSRADQKSLRKRDQRKSTSSSQVILPRQIASKQQKTENQTSTKMLMQMDKSLTNSASFNNVSDERRESRNKRSYKESQLTDAYLVTNSEYTLRDDAFAGQTVSTLNGRGRPQTDHTHNNNTSRDQGQQQQQQLGKQLIISQIMSPKLMGQSSTTPRQLTAHQQSVMPSQNTQTNGLLNDSFSESVMPSSTTQNQTLQKNHAGQPLLANSSQNSQPVKQTFPLRVRKHQHFIKGPDCPSIKSQSTVYENQNVIMTPEDQNLQKADTETVMKHENGYSDGQEGTDGVYYSYDMIANQQLMQNQDICMTLQQEIMQEYDNQIGSNSNRQCSSSSQRADQTCLLPKNADTLDVVVHGDQQQRDPIADSSRNQARRITQESHQSEISRMQTAFEVSDYLFHQNQSNPLGAGAQNSCNWTNQTSRFQLGVTGENSSQKVVELKSIGEDGAASQKHKQLQLQQFANSNFVPAAGAAFLRSSGESNGTGNQYKRGKSNEDWQKSQFNENRRTPTLEQQTMVILDDQRSGNDESDQDTMDENGDEQMRQQTEEQEQRPLMDPDSAQRASTLQAKKAKLNRDLPLQQVQKQHHKQQLHQRDASSQSKSEVIGVHKASEQSRITFLEQRNKHLELELKRHQVHLGQTDELHQKYKGLKIDYRQLLQSFERSEEIRREQKELINEQRQQMKHLKSKLKKQESKMGLIARDIDALKLAQSNDLSSVLDLSKVQSTTHSVALKNSRSLRGNTQPITQNAYNSSTGQMSHRSPTMSNASSRKSRSSAKGKGLSRESSSQPSASQNNRSQFHPPGVSSYGGVNHSQVVQSGCSDFVGSYPQHQTNLTQLNQPQLMTSYLGGGAMLAGMHSPGNDLGSMPEGYSVICDIAASSAEQSKVLARGSKSNNKKHRHKSSNRQRKRRDDSQRASNTSSLDRCQNNTSRNAGQHKQHHGRKRSKRHKQSGRKERNRSHSAASSRSTRKSREKLGQPTPFFEDENIMSLMMMQQQPEDIFSMDHSLNLKTSHKPTSKERKRKYAPYKTNSTADKPRKLASRSKHKLKSGQTVANDPNQAGYIFNIQTSASDIMKGVHKFQSTRGSQEQLQDSHRRSRSKNKKLNKH